jgi:RNA 2',3'-cyclic 3'-phosphodiesterase
MRTFVAIEIPVEIRKRIQELIVALERAPVDIRWSRPESLHITLQFLGEVAPEKIGPVKARLETLPEFGPLPIDIRGAGFFPNERAARVLWLGIHAGPELAQLAERIGECLVPLGFSKEDRPFAPHLTLGRMRTSKNLSALRELLRLKEPLEMGSFVARDFFLYESQSAPGGSVYRRLARFPVSEPQ